MKLEMELEPFERNPSKVQFTTKLIHNGTVLMEIQSKEFKRGNNALFQSNWERSMIRAFKEVTKDRRLFALFTTTDKSI
jgi:hypothetical protein